MSLRHYSEYSPSEGQAVERAYESRKEAVRAKTREIATKPIELLYIIDSEVIAALLADLMREFYRHDDVLAAAYSLCKALDYKASISADMQVPDVDEEAIEAQLGGDR